MTVGHQQAVEWYRSAELVAYEPALRWMEERVEAIRAGRAAECVWLLEHPPLYTAGTSARPEELLDPRFPVYRAGRGGRFTYHGPGQRVVYVMLDLARRGRDVRGFVATLEEWLIRTLSDFGVRGERRPGRVGIWVPLADGREGKLAAIGVRLRHWVSYHGMAINLAPDLGHFSGIVPCGLAGYPVVSLASLGHSVPAAAFDAALCRHFEELFATATVPAEAPAALAVTACAADAVG